jgi:hypothetical protein
VSLEPLAASTAPLAHSAQAGPTVRRSGGTSQESLGATVTALEFASRNGSPELAQAIPRLLSDATDAFITDLQSTASVAIALLLAGTILGVVWLPDRTKNDTERACKNTQRDRSFRSPAASE